MSVRVSITNDRINLRVGSTTMELSIFEAMMLLEKLEELLK